MILPCQIFIKFRPKISYNWYCCQRCCIYRNRFELSRDLFVLLLCSMDNELEFILVYFERTSLILIYSIVPNYEHRLQVTVMCSCKKVASHLHSHVRWLKMLNSAHAFQQLLEFHIYRVQRVAVQEGNLGEHYIVCSLGLISLSFLWQLAVYFADKMQIKRLNDSKTHNWIVWTASWNGQLYQMLY